MLRELHRRPVLALALGVALEIAFMFLLSPELVPFPPGTPGGIGVAVAVLAALAAGPAVGAGVAVVGWGAFMLLVARGDELALVALPVWALVASAAGVIANMLVATEHELAERETEREELRRVNALKNQFIALASHELRTPAAAVYGISATLEKHGDKLQPEQLKQLRHTLYEQSVRLRTLIDQLLDLSKLEANAIRIRPEPVPVHESVQRLVRLLDDERRDEVEVDVSPDLVATVDRNAFERIVGNLVTNAFRYGGAPITISAEQRDRHFRLTVEDRGEGVPAELVPDLFERFTRSERARDQRPGSAGLGLAIARSYAHAHGGELLYESAEPQGARFELVLPRPSVEYGEPGADDGRA